MSNYEILTLLIAVISVGIALTSMMRTRILEEKHTQLAELTAELSKKQIRQLDAEEMALTKALIDVELEKYGDDYRFVLSNIGGATAKDINFSFEGGCPVIASEIKNKTPISELRPGKSIEYIATRSFESADTYKVNLRWFDPDGQQINDQINISW